MSKKNIILTFFKQFLKFAPLPLLNLGWITSPYVYIIKVKLCKVCVSSLFFSKKNLWGSARSPLVQLVQEGLTLFIPGFFGWCSTGSFPPTPCNSFVFKVRRLKFCTELLWGRVRIKSLMTSSLLDEYRKLLKTAYFQITAASLSFIESY